MKWAISLIACLAFPLTAQAAQAPPIPLGLECYVADAIHSNEFPNSSTEPEYLQYMNHCILMVQTYARVHCPKSKLTIWQQVETVASHGHSGDTKALLAACN